VDAGNMPAAVVSHAICQARDPFWLLTHETISLTIWFLIGLGVDLGRFRLRTEMLVFLALRAVLVAGTRASNSFWRPAASLEGLVWLALAIWGAGWCVNRFRSTAPSRSRLRSGRARRSNAHPIREYTRPFECTSNTRIHTSIRMHIHYTNASETEPRP
jgi:hypothetical protein